MRLRLRSGCWVMAAVCLAVGPAACGSDDGKKDADNRYTRPGEGGEGGGAGDSSDGASGEPTGPGGGSGGSGNTGASGGAGGEGNANVGGSLGGEAASGAATGGALTGGAAGADGSGGAGGDGGVPPFNGLYVGPDGSDAAAGTEAAPFETLAHAASVAEAGDTIVFLDGVIPTSGTATAIPAGVNLMAKNAGAATLTGTGVLLTIQGNTRIEGLRFTGQTIVASFAGVGADPGVLTVVDSTFTNCVSSCLQLTGTARAVVTAQPTGVLGNGGGSFAAVQDTAELQITGGILQNYDGGYIFMTRQESHLQLKDVQITDGDAGILYMLEESTAQLEGVTAATLAPGLFRQTGETQLTVLGSDLRIKPNAAAAYFCFRLEMNGIGSVRVEDSKLQGCGTGFNGTLPASIIIDTVEVSNMNFGIDAGYGGGGLGGVVHISNSNFHDFVYMSARMGSGSNLNEFVFRDTVFSNPVTSMWDNVWLEGSNASTFDLGTLADPGGNTFVNANPATTALRVQMQAAYVSAVGNTWTVDQQGADAAGKYAAVGAGAKLEITAAVASGRNYIKPYAGTTLLLAENPL